MALKASVVVENLTQIENMFDQLGQKVSNKITRKALRAGSKSMLNTTRNMAPVDTGLMKRSLTVLALKRKAGRIGFRIGFKNVAQIVERSTFGRGMGPQKSRFTNQSKRRHFYPAVIEYGAKNRPAKPFMRPAFERNKDGAMKIINEELRLGIDEAVRQAV